MAQPRRKILTMERDWGTPSPVAAGRKGSAEAVRRSPLRLVPREQRTATRRFEAKEKLQEPSRSWAVEVAFAVLGLGAALTVWLSVR
jgi:hypothetical protein